MYYQCYSKKRFYYTSRHGNTRYYLPVAHQQFICNYNTFHMFYVLSDITQIYRRDVSYHKGKVLCRASCELWSTLSNTQLDWTRRAVCRSCIHLAHNPTKGTHTKIIQTVRDRAELSRKEAKLLFLSNLAGKLSIHLDA